MMTLPFKTFAGIIWLSGAASMMDCHVLVESGITNPNSKYHSSRHFPLNSTFCSNLNFSICSFDVKFNSRETARHFRIFFGTRASCSTPGCDKSSLLCHSTFPESASLRFIQFSLKPFKMLSTFDCITDLLLCRMSD